MCGICGIIDWKNTGPSTARVSLVEAMNHALIHRGPDDAGIASSGNSSLAMRRLSIIDTGGGHQPIYNETEDVVVVYNGEIYNFIELRESLLQKGHQFRTASDTEVLVHLYEEMGTAMLPLLKGMFAFCIYDIRQNSYLLARDRFGEKPLFYHWQQGVFSFSSEIKSLLENSHIQRRLNKVALPYYFRTSLVPEPMTLLEDIYSLPPGHFLQLDAKGLREATYFEASYPKIPAIQTEAEAVEVLRPLLKQAVRRQTVSDVPIGAFLSGGIDSSTVVALLQQQQSKKIPTFNVRFEDQTYDESAVARKVAEFCGTDHQEIFIPDMDFEESIFWEIIDHVGFPFRDSSAIPSYFISKEIAKYVKVALSGDGGDELFGGYDLFQWYQKIVGLKKVARPIRSLVNEGLGWTQKIPGLKQLSLFRQIKRGVDTSLQPLADIPISLNEMFSPQSIAHLLNGSNGTGAIWENPQYPLLKEAPDLMEEWSSLRKIMYYRLRHTLPTNMLVKVDRMSMAHSLEVRAPFLDADLFDASVQLFDNLLVREGKGKYILRKIMEKELPAEVFNHPKTGFNIPLYKYQNEAFKNLAKRLLFDENPWPNLIAPDRLKEIYHKGIATSGSTASESVFQTAHQLWMMMQLFGWAKRFKVQYVD